MKTDTALTVERLTPARRWGSGGRTVSRESGSGQRPLFERMDYPPPWQPATIRYRRQDELRVSRLLVSSILVSVAVASVWVVIAFWAWPSSIVRVAPLASQVPITVGVLVEPDLRSVDVSARAIPGIVVEAVTSDTISMPTTGRRREPEGFAIGRVTLRNRTGEVLIVPRNTRVTTQQGTVFLTDVEVLVPPTVQIADRMVPGEATVGIAAERPGVNGNVPAFAIGVVGGPQSAMVEVFNSHPVSGAAEREVALVSQRDVDELARILMERLQSAAVEQLKRDRPEQHSLVVWSSEAGNPEVVHQEFSADVDQLAAVLRLDMAVRARGTMYANEDLERIIRNELMTTGSSAPFDDVRLLNTEVLKDSFGRLELGIDAVGESVEELDTGALRTALAGADLDTAVSVLNSLTQVVKWRVVHDPPDTANFPRWAWRINVETTTPIAVPAG